MALPIERSAGHAEHNHLYKETIISPELGYLEDSGFNVWGELSRDAFNYLNYTQKGQTQEAAKKRILSETEGNIRGFIWEYMQKNKVLHNPVWLGAIEGEGVDVRSSYGDRPLRQMLDWNERLGMSAQGNIDSYDFLINAPKNSIAAIASSKGLTGYPKGKGPVRHDMSQLFTFKKTPHGLDSFTFVTSMSPLENKMLLEVLDSKSRSDGKSKTELEWVSEIVGSPALVEGSDQDISFEDLGNLIKKIRREAMGEDFDLDRWAEIEEEHREIMRNLARKDELKEVGSSCEVIMDRFKSELSVYLPDIAQAIKHLNLEEVTQDNVADVVKALKTIPKGHKIAQKLSKSLLEAYALVTGNVHVERVLEGNLTENEFKTLHAQIILLGGCNGGGAGLGLENGTIGDLLNILMGGDSRYSPGHCSKCQRIFFESAVWRKEDGGCGWCIYCEQKDNRGEFDSHE